MFKCNESVTSLDLCPVIVLLDIQFMNLLLVVCWLGILNCSENTCLLHFINFSILEKMLLLWLTILFITLYWRSHTLQYDEGWTMNCVEILYNATTWSVPALAVFFKNMYRICSPDKDHVVKRNEVFSLWSEHLDPVSQIKDCLLISFFIKLTKA